MPRRKTLRDKIEQRMARKPGDAVFLTREFADLGGEDQVLRALRGLVRDGRLLRLGYGVYGRAVRSRLSGEPMLHSPHGFIGAARRRSTSSASRGNRRKRSGPITRADQRKSRSTPWCA